MEQAVDTPDRAAAGPVRGAAEPDPASVEKQSRLPNWWHRDHPVFVPLAGFFTGMVYIILVPGTYGAALKALVGYERAETLFPFVLATLVVPIALVVPPRTRTFGRYMLIGVAATAAVVVVTAVVVLWFLLNRDG